MLDLESNMYCSVIGILVEYINLSVSTNNTSLMNFASENILNIACLQLGSQL